MQETINSIRQLLHSSQGQSVILCWGSVWIGLATCSTGGHIVDCAVGAVAITAGIWAFHHGVHF